MKVAVLLMLPCAYECNAADYSFAFAFMVQRCLITIVKVDCQRRALAPSVYYKYRDRSSARSILSQRRSSRSTTMAMPSSYLVSPPEVVSSMKCLTFRSARIVLPFSTISNNSHYYMRPPILAFCFNYVSGSLVLFGAILAPSRQHRYSSAKIT